MERLASALPLLIVAAHRRLGRVRARALRRPVLRQRGPRRNAACPGCPQISPRRPACSCARRSSSRRWSLPAPIVTGDANGVARALGRDHPGRARPGLHAAAGVGHRGRHRLFGRRLAASVNSRKWAAHRARVGHQPARGSADGRAPRRNARAALAVARCARCACSARALGSASTSRWRPARAQDVVRDVLREAGRKCGRDARVDLLTLRRRRRAVYRLSALCDSLDARQLARRNRAWRLGLGRYRPRSWRTVRE